MVAGRAVVTWLAATGVVMLGCGTDGESLGDAAVPDAVAPDAPQPDASLDAQLDAAPSDGAMDAVVPDTGPLADASQPDASLDAQLDGAPSDGAMDAAGDADAPPCPIHVHGAAGDDAHDGTSWETARATLHAGLDAAEAYGCDLWVAGGTYHPTDDDDRLASFQLRPGIALYGGFAGDEGALDDRDVEGNETILSGDLGVSDVHLDNSYHVVLGAPGARLDGFTVRGGFADGVGDRSRGGGLFNDGGDMTVAHCRFEHNGTGDSVEGGAGSIGDNGGQGGAVYQGAGTLTITSSVFADNWTGAGANASAIGGSGGRGGAIACVGGSLHILESTFADNATGDGGSSSGATSGAGGVGGHGAAVAFASDGVLSVVGTTFARNATGAGGGCTATTGNCVAGGGGEGAGLHVTGQGHTTVEASRFEDNATGPGGSAASNMGGPGGAGAGMAVHGAGLRVAGSVFAGNTTGDGGGGVTFAGPGGAGAGLWALVGDQDAIVADCTFVDNATGVGGEDGTPGEAGNGGGADLRVRGAGDLVIASVTFAGNGGSMGGGLRVDANHADASGAVTLVNAVFHRNTAALHGGGMSYRGAGHSGVVVANATFEGNGAGAQGGALAYQSTEDEDAAGALLVNSILWGNAASFQPELAGMGSAANTRPLEVHDNDIEGGCVDSAHLACGSNLEVPPAFGDAPGGDLTLLSTSPLIDEGHTPSLPPDLADLDDDGDTDEPTPLDRAGQPRVGGDAVDMGAYERQ
jgi:hypothetical protein